jgi:hypothetical protein
MKNFGEIKKSEKFLIQVSHKQGHPHSLLQILIDAAQYMVM